MRKSVYLYPLFTDVARRFIISSSALITVAFQMVPASSDSPKWLNMKTSWDLVRFRTGPPACQCTAWPQESGDAAGPYQAGWLSRFPLAPTGDIRPWPWGAPHESPPVRVGGSKWMMRYELICAHLLTSILARVCRWRAWSLRSFPKAVRRVA